MRTVYVKVDLTFYHVGARSLTVAHNGSSGPTRQKWQVSTRSWADTILAPVLIPMKFPIITLKEKPTEFLKPSKFQGL